VYLKRHSACVPVLGACALLASVYIVRADDASTAPVSSSGDDATLSALVAKEGSSMAQLKSLVETLLRADPELAKTLSADPDLKQLMARAGITPPDQVAPPTASETPAAAGTDDARRTAKAELAQAQAMADAALASRTAADSSASTNAGSPTPAAAGAVHSTTSDLVNASASLDGDSSDPSHHSMSSLIDGQ
jgi:hypothetical protein